MTTAADGSRAMRPLLNLSPALMTAQKPRQAKRWSRLLRTRTSASRYISFRYSIKLNTVSLV